VRSDWARYYDARADAVRETLLAALDRFPEPGLAVDLGCGAGADAAELLRRGWRVLAVDSEPEAVDRLRRRADLGPGGLDRLHTRVARMEHAELPAAQLVNASWSLPFCRPEAFPAVWRRITLALVPGGRFCGQLFGDRDGWRGEQELTFLSRPQVDSLLEGFEAEILDEVERDGRTALGEPKHWHVFNVVARKLEPAEGAHVG
jgi:tellurite methyltransferase